MPEMERLIGPSKFADLRMRAAKPQKADPVKWRLYLLGEAKKLGVTLQGGDKG